MFVKVILGKELLGVDERCSFVDIGCGSGIIVILCAFLYRCGSKGVEVHSDRYAFARRVLRDFVEGTRSEPDQGDNVRHSVSYACLL